MIDNIEIMENSEVIETPEIIAESTENIEMKPRRRKKDSKESASTENPAAGDSSEITAPAPTESATSGISASKKCVYKTGDVFETKLSLLYKSCVAPKHSKVIKGKFYIWNDEVYHGRIRLTDSPSGVGRIDRIIGWIKVSE